jgi:hypothetical protein
MDQISKLWLCIGKILKSHPATYVGLTIGLILVIAALAYSTVNTTLNDKEIRQLQGQLCSDENYEKCNLLLDRLLKHPTKEQKERLQEIIKDKR